MAESWSQGYQRQLAARGIINTNIWQWSGFALLGVFIYAWIPRRDKAAFLFMILLGGLVYLQRNGGLNGLVQTLTSGQVNIPNPPPVKE